MKCCQGEIGSCLHEPWFVLVGMRQGTVLGTESNRGYQQRLSDGMDAAQPA